MRPYSLARSVPLVEAACTKLNAPRRPATVPSKDSIATYVPTPEVWSKADVNWVTLRPRHVGDIVGDVEVGRREGRGAQHEADASDPNVVGIERSRRVNGRACGCCVAGAPARR